MVKNQPKTPARRFLTAMAIAAPFTLSGCADHPQVVQICEGSVCEAFPVQDARSRAISLEHIMARNPFPVAAAFAISAGLEKSDLVSAAGKANAGNSSAFYDREAALARDLIPLVQTGTMPERTAAKVNAVVADIVAIDNIAMHPFLLPAASTLDPVALGKVSSAFFVLKFATSSVARDIEWSGYLTEPQVSEVMTTATLNWAHVPATTQPKASAAVRPYMDLYARFNPGSILTRTLVEGADTHPAFPRELINSAEYADGALMMGKGKANSISHPTPFGPSYRASDLQTVVHPKKTHAQDRLTGLLQRSAAPGDLSHNP